MSIQQKNDGVYVIHGAYDGSFDLAGTSVADAQRALLDAFHIRSLAIALVNGKEVEPTFTLSAGDRLEFVYRSETKGFGDLLTPEELIERWRISQEQYRELQNLGLPRIAFDKGVVRHSEIAVDEWWRSLTTNCLPVKRGQQQMGALSWQNSAVTEPPTSHQFGPLVGSQGQLSSWIHPHENPDPRYLKGRAVTGVVWVRKIHARLYEVWFRSKWELDQAIARRERAQMKPP